MPRCSSMLVSRGFWQVKLIQQYPTHFVVAGFPDVNYVLSINRYMDYVASVPVQIWFIWEWGDETLTLSTFLPHDDELRTKLDWTSQCRGSDGQCYPMLIAVHLMAWVDRWLKPIFKQIWRCWRCDLWCLWCCLGFWRRILAKSSVCNLLEHKAAIWTVVQSTSLTLGGKTTLQLWTLSLLSWPPVASFDWQFWTTTCSFGTFTWFWHTLTEQDVVANMEFKWPRQKNTSSRNAWRVVQRHWF